MGIFTRNLLHNRWILRFVTLLRGVNGKKSRLIWLRLRHNHRNYANSEIDIY